MSFWREWFKRREREKSMKGFPLTEVSSDDLIAELKRRSIACAIITLQLEEGKGAPDVWRIAVGGSPILLASCATVLAHKIQEYERKHLIDPRKEIP